MSKIIFKRKLHESVNIPPELANQYLAVKKQMSDKVGKKDQLMKSVNQIDQELNILNRNLLAIETKAAQMQGEKVEQQDKTEQEQAQSTQTIEVQGKVIESADLDRQWQEYISEAEDVDDETIEDIEDHGPEIEDNDMDEPEGDSLEGDYVFAVRIIDTAEEEDIIAKFYQDEDDDFWKARVVQGSEEPIESMQFDPDMEMLEIIEHLATIYDEVQEIDTDDYEEMLDDKEVIDDIYYDDIIK
jgi:hypothetical protein